jgi:hypothetical protein
MHNCCVNTLYVYKNIYAGDAPGDEVAGGTELVLAGLGAGGGAGGGLPAWSLAATQVLLKHFYSTQQ